MSEIAWIDMTVAIEVLSSPESSVRTKGIIVLKFVSATKDTPIPVQKMTITIGDKFTCYL